MQALRLAEIVDELANELQVDQLAAVLQPMIQVGQNREVSPATKEAFASLLWDGRGQFTRLTSDDEVRTVTALLGTEHAFATPTLTQILTLINGANSTDQIWGNPTSMLVVTNYLQALEGLIAARRLVDALIMTRAEVLAPDDGLFMVEAYDVSGDGLSIEDMENVLRELKQLHDAAVSALEVGAPTARLAVLDSGSDVIIGLQSAKGVVELIKLAWAMYSVTRKVNSAQLIDEANSIGLHLKVLASVEEAKASGRVSEPLGDHLAARLTKRLEALTSFGVGPHEPERSRARLQKQLVVDPTSVKRLQTEAAVDENET